MRIIVHTPVGVFASRVEDAAPEVVEQFKTEMDGLAERSGRLSMTGADGSRIIICAGAMAQSVIVIEDAAAAEETKP